MSRTSRHRTGRRLPAAAFFVLILSLFAAQVAGAQQLAAEAIPLPEHPRPDFERAAWLNLNGTWRFHFDPENAGEREAWFRDGLPGARSITVPFPWGAPLSGVADSADIGWYARTVEVPEAWRGRRVFLVIGASDWHTTAWLDGQRLGTHQGGYTPFEFELTPYVQPGQAQQLVIRVDDTPHAFKLEGKQGYGPARGIWQTPYLEARGAVPLSALHFSPDLSGSKVSVTAHLLEPAPADLTLRLDFRTGDLAPVTQPVPQGAEQVTFDVPVADPHLWSLEDPFLYEVEATLGGEGAAADQVRTYFGMRSISVVNLPGTDFPYIALNGKPVYLQLALDQAYHPEGFYTFPSDEFARDEVLRARQIGLNGLRIHVKVGLPRKLYWADRLGMLIMADVPNSWGEPDADLRGEVEYALRQMIRRDYNHPSIFAWVPFNETWGLVTDVDGKGEYLPETQEWVVSVVELTRQLDPTRLVEDNSICCGRGHTVTDINSWHFYLPGYGAAEHLDEIVANTYPGSTFHFEEGYSQGRQPLINSEFGNVWGYEGSTGDVDWSWDYHIFINEYRKRPKIAGWLYTEHHDVINEWNGYWRYDRSEKETGLSELVEGMTLRDLHAPLYIVVGDRLSQEVRPGEQVQVPLWASFFTDSRAYGDALTLDARLYGWNTLGQKQTYVATSRRVPYRPWMNEALDPLDVSMPDAPGVAVLATELKDAAGHVLQRNFTTFIVGSDVPERVQAEDGTARRLVRIDPARFSDASWSLKHWQVLDGLKVNGAGAGFFEYRVPWPLDVDPADVASAVFLVEASAKQLFGKDRDDAGEMRGDYMRGEGSLDPSLNPNAYPMTDETPFPSAVTVRVDGEVAGRFELSDDPADHRGILSWHSQKQDRRLREAGSYGYLLNVALPPDALRKAASDGSLVLRLEVEEALPGGLAIYGRRFGRYPLDPTVVFTLHR